MSEHRLDRLLIERHRHGMRGRPKGEKKALRKLTEEATDEGLLCPYVHKRKRTKYFSDHLAPLRRWLRSRVGDPWHEVYDDLSRFRDKSTLSGHHFLAHLWAEVTREVEIVDGVPYPISRRYNDRPLGWRRERLYIHPETGILCLAPRIKPRSPAREQEKDYLPIDENSGYRKIEGIWYRVTFEKFDRTNPCFDVVQKKYITAIEAQVLYRRQVYTASKRQCNKREVRLIRQRLK